MGKLIKVTVSLIIVVILTLIIGVTLLITFVNPNVFKDEISTYVQQQTGRELTIHGDIKWSFFPWLGFKVSSVDLANASNFGKTPFASIKEADVKIKLVPLFSGKVETGNLLFNGLALNLQKNADGITNWQDLIQKTKTTPTSKPTAKPTPKAQRKPIKLTISNIEIKNSSIKWTNQQTKQAIYLSKIQLRSKDVNFGNPFSVNMRFTIKSNQPKLHADISIASKITLNPAQSEYDFQSLILTLRLLQNNQAQDADIYKLSGNAAFNLNQQTLSIVGLTLNNNGLQLSADINGSKILQTPLFQGQLKLFPLRLRSYLKAHGISVVTNNPNVLQNVSAIADFQASPKYLKLKNIKAKIDNINLSGNFDYADFIKNTIAFNIRLNKINLDHYLPLAMTTITNPKTITKRPATNPSKPSKNKASKNIPFLNRAKISGSISISNLTAYNIKTSKVNAELATNNGIIKLSPFSANLYSGTTRGWITMNLRGKTPRYAIHETIANVQLNPLLRDMQNTDKIGGRANLTMDLSMAGNNTEQMIRTLNGKAKLQIKNGIYYGVNLDHQLGRAYAFIKRRPMPSTTGAAETRFRRLTGTANIKNGIIHNNDLIVQTQTLQATGQGTANLNNHKLSYRLLAVGIRERQVTPSKTVIEEQKTKIPLLLTGTFESPKLLPDFETIAKLYIQKKVEETVKKTVGGVIEKQLQKGGDIGRDVGEKIKKSFQFDKLFGN